MENDPKINLKKFIDFLKEKDIFRGELDGLVENMRTRSKHWAKWRFEHTEPQCKAQGHGSYDPPGYKPLKNEGDVYMKYKINRDDTIRTSQVIIYYTNCSNDLPTQFQLGVIISSF